MSGDMIMIDDKIAFLDMRNLIIMPSCRSSTALESVIEGQSARSLEWTCVTLCLLSLSSLMIIKAHSNEEA